MDSQEPGDGRASHEEAPDDKELGLVDGSTISSTRRYQVVLNDDQFVQLDELVATRQTLPGAKELTHYGIVVEGTGQIEGADLASDTERIAAAHTMPGNTSRRVEVQILRTVPEVWLAPNPGAAVVRAEGVQREYALFLDQMDKPLPAGLDQAGRPVYVDFAYLNGEKGAHASISGISGVATKTSYALFLLYMLFETEAGRALLGHNAPNTRALVFNVKGEDLLHIDRPNGKFPANEQAAREWAQLGVPRPGAFDRVRLFAPRSGGSREGSVVTDVVSRDSKEVRAFGWSPIEFIRKGLLRFCFSEAEDAQTQISYIEQRVRIQLARWAYPLENEPGSVVLISPETATSFNFARVVAEQRRPRPAGDGFPVRSFSDLVDFLTSMLAPEDSVHDHPEWHAGTVPGTRFAFMRRLYGQQPRIGHLITSGVELVALEEPITVVDIHSLHDTAQRFVVGALLSEVFENKQGRGREPLQFVVLDELNKYAPRDGTTPIKEMLVDIAARGRSMGVILIGAQQSAHDVERAIVQNASIKVVGRLDAGEASEYKFLSSEVRERASRFLPGTMVLDQPLIPAPLPIRFPFPAFATCVSEGAVADAAERRALEDKILSKL